MNHRIMDASHIEQTIRSWNPYYISLLLYGVIESLLRCNSCCIVFHSDCEIFFWLQPIADPTIRHAIVRKYLYPQPITLHHPETVRIIRRITSNVTMKPITVLPIKIGVHVLFPMFFRPIAIDFSDCFRDLLI